MIVAPAARAASIAGCRSGTPGLIDQIGIGERRERVAAELRG